MTHRKTSPKQPTIEDKEIVPQNGTISLSLLPCVIIDTREQLPYSFPAEHFTTERSKLDEADYTLKGFEKKVGLERKSVDDFTASITEDRFWREMGRLRDYDRAAVVVEASRADILERRYRSNIDPRAVLGAEAAIFCDFGVSVVWASTRPLAVDFARRFLLRYWKQNGVTQHEPESKRDESK